MSLAHFIPQSSEFVCTLSEPCVTQSLKILILEKSPQLYCIFRHRDEYNQRKEGEQHSEGRLQHGSGQIILRKILMVNFLYWPCRHVTTLTAAEMQNFCYSRKSVGYMHENMVIRTVPAPHKIITAAGASASYGNFHQPS